jgi:lysophospholipase L1-like esterase
MQREHLGSTVWFFALLAMLPWLLALQHLGALPAEAARQDLADGRWWPGLLPAMVIGSGAVSLAIIGSWLLARRTPHLVAGVLILLALIMGWVVRPMAWRHAPVDVFLIERGKIWVVWFGLSVLGIGVVAAVGFLARRSARLAEARGLLMILVLLGGGARTGRAQRPDAAAAAALDATRFEAEIRAFEAADRASPPPLGGVVFVGSSSIKNWTDVAADFPGVPVLNRGFGGSTMADVVYYADRAVLRYRPRLIVLYAGDNDLVGGRTPERILGDYRAFLKRVRSALPATRVVYVSIKPSPSRRGYMDRAREANRLVQLAMAGDSLQTYVDVFTPMLSAKGQPRPELFLADSLHMNQVGYRLWRGILAPVVRPASP